MKGKFGIPTLIASGATARALMAGIPNVEPILLVSMLAGMRYGPVKGFFTGFFAMLVSDLYIGLPGPWTLFTTFGFGLVGFMAGFLPKAYVDNRKKLTTAAGVFTFIYQAIVNSAWPLLTGSSLLVATMMGIPFAAIQILSNMLIVPLTLPLAMAVMDAIPIYIEQLNKNIYKSILRI